ncbi:MAG: tyrosine phosphatase-like protein [Piptocephalis tieghemiana]|nr:MAG: tyrosine phosphatase-like protein [Piptocephalis tieghemiana]
MNAYLIAYNSSSCLLWLYIGALTLAYTLGTTQSPSALVTLGPPVRLALMTACLEVIHAILGLVRSSVGPTVIQTLTRLIILTGVCEGLGNPEAITSPALPIMCGVWAVSEMVRYAYYLVLLPPQQLKRAEGPSSPGGSAPITIQAILQWARYSLFYVLYPLGAGSEAYLLYLSLPSIAQAYGLGGTLFTYGLLALYPFGLIHMMSHMHRQRCRHIKGPHSQSNKGTKGH